MWVLSGSTVSGSASRPPTPRLEDACRLGRWPRGELANEGPVLEVMATATPHQLETGHDESEEPGAGPVLIIFLQGTQGHSASPGPPYLPRGRVK